MISAIIVCFTTASSNWTLRWSPVLPPGMQGTRGVWGGIQNHAFLRQEAVTLLVRCGWGGDDHTWQQNISRGPGLRRLLTERLCAAGAAEEPGLQWRRLGAQVSAAFREARAAAAMWSSQHTLSRHSAPPIVGEPGQQGERSHFAFLEKGLRNEPPKESGKKSERQIPASS